jgi:hypothetical protein
MAEVIATDSTPYEPASIASCGSWLECCRILRVDPGSLTRLSGSKEKHQRRQENNKPDQA